MKREPIPSTERRSFLTSLKLGAAGLAIAGAADAQMKPAAHFEAQRHDKDDWLDQLPGKHRVVFDATQAEGFGEGVLFANNYLLVNQNDYGIPAHDLAVVIVVRYRAAAFGYNNAMWAKYSSPIAARARFTDPRTQKAPQANLYGAENYGGLLPSNGATWPILAGKGVQLAVCSSATHAYAAEIAQATAQKPDAVYAELISNLVGNARVVPAGIVTVTRAQERGYSLVST